MQWKKKFTAVLSALTLCFGVFGCSKFASTESVAQADRDATGEAISKIDFTALKKENEKKQRLIVLTDINTDLKQAKEQDDVESLCRLLLYSNEIDIEGLIATTSCWLKGGAGDFQLNDILNVIDSYGKVKSNLDVHDSGYPSAEYLKSISKKGVPSYGKKLGAGFGEAKYNENDGVKLIIDAVDRDDERPVWFSVWGGINTLAQAVWTVQQSRTVEEFDKFLSKIRIYAIFDQDEAGYWLRENFGDKLYYIVSPTNIRDSKDYERGISPAISTEHNGADNGCVTKEWIKTHIQDKGEYGKAYPNVAYIMEGDSPSFMHLIKNGLNIPSNIELGSWGGRYVKRLPVKDEFKTTEKYPIYTNGVDTVTGVDGKEYSNYRATLFRWRSDFQNDFSARMDWTTTDDFNKANHNPVIADNFQYIEAAGDVVLSVDAHDPNGQNLSYDWFYYREAGSYDGDITLTPSEKTCKVNVPSEAKGKIILIVCRVVNDNPTPLCSYARFFISVK